MELARRDEPRAGAPIVRIEERELEADAHLDASSRTSLLRARLPLVQSRAGDQAGPKSSTRL